MNWLLAIVTIVATVTILPTNAEFYSSIHKMSHVMNFELRMLKNMQKFIGKNENKLDYLKERLAEYEREHNEAVETGTSYFENPVNKYLLTKRLTTDWDRLENILQYKEGKKTLKKIKNTMVNETELDGALEGVLRLQDIYRLNTSDIASGLLQGVQYDVDFKARHCFDIGKRAMETQYIKLGYFWLKEALKRSAEDDSVDILDIELAIADVQFRLGDIQGANETYAELSSRYPESEKVAKLFAEFGEKSVDKQQFAVDYSAEHLPPPADMFTANNADLFKYTCAGLIKKTPAEERELQCGYLVETHPFLWLAPIKVEELHHDPLMVIFHDVLSDKEIETLKEMNHQIERATVISTNGSVVSNVRTSQSRFIPATKHPLLAKIDQRVEDMTNLNMRYAEDHQFANYGIGGHYSEHFDYFDTNVNLTIFSYETLGNRIATVLFYLSDVEQGGGTAYPFMKQLVMPKKGAAAFWYNLHASGVPDTRSLHGACPIIVGSKWVQNRWIREHDQSDRRPCYLFNDAI
ncbi:prolyl 4-hydroxylase subunit alpha-2-like [Musca vetustissima]|uniref:prolyl 4-hydroxylase subunit alpha-2-like n=1 Tax=Musca vetustissima TaxID=27455 RepID=UPI002AB704E0|nr:prolyl 4-hydroxylase subunit alpha-2-like [Musca vetustissima]